MTAVVNDILNIVEGIAPVHLAEEWDNVGLQLGSRQWPVKRVFTALDVTSPVIEEVAMGKGNVLVTHHPLIFSPLRILDLDVPLGRMLQELITHRIAVISAHTNLDSVAGGINDVLGSYLPIELLTVLQPSVQKENSGLGRVGDLLSPTNLGDLAAAVKTHLSIPSIRYVGDPQLSIQRVALCSGSGASLLDAFFASGAQVFITGDVRYHDARAIEARGLGVIDIGHFESEHIMVDTFANQLAEQFRAAGLDVDVGACRSERTPFTVL